MLNQLNIITIPQSSAQGSGTRSEVSAIAARSDGTSRPEEYATDPFSALLARQMGENVAAENFPATVNLPEIKTITATADGENEQDKTLAALPDQASNPLLAILFANQELKVAVANESGSKLVIANEHGSKVAVANESGSKLVISNEPDSKVAVANEPSGNISAALRSAPAPQTPLQQLGTVPSREKLDPPVTVSAKTDAVISGQPGLHSEPLKTAEFSSAPPVAAPVPQIQAQANTLLTPGLKQTQTTANAITAPLGSNAWPEEFSQKVSWVSTQKNQVAELHLNPPDLGPINIVLKISDNQATALFTSPHSAVRDAIENAMPKLRESLAENGIMLGNATVSDHTRTTPDNTTPAESALASLPLMAARQHKGMVDTFA